MIQNPTSFHSPHCPSAQALPPLFPHPSTPSGPVQSALGGHAWGQAGVSLATRVNAWADPGRCISILTSDFLGGLPGTSQNVPQGLAGAQRCCLKLTPLAGHFIGK